MYGAVSLLQTSVAAGASGPLIVLSGVADISTITQLSGVITSQLSEITRQLMIDVSGLRFADPAAISLLLLVARTLRGQGGSMVLIRPQPAVARAVTLADPDQIITIQGRTPRTPKSEGGGGSPGLGPRCRDLPSTREVLAQRGRHGLLPDHLPQIPADQMWTNPHARTLIYPVHGHNGLPPPEPLTPPTSPMLRTFLHHALLSVLTQPLDDPCLPLGAGSGSMPAKALAVQIWLIAMRVGAGCAR